MDLWNVKEWLDPALMIEWRKECSKRGKPTLLGRLIVVWLRPLLGSPIPIRITTAMPWVLSVNRHNCVS